MPTPQSSLVSPDAVEDVPPSGFFGNFDKFSKAFEHQFKRPFRKTGTTANNPLHARAALGGNAMDVGSKEFGSEHLDWVRANAPAYGLRALVNPPGFDPHIHLEGAKGNVKADDVEFDDGSSPASPVAPTPTATTAPGLVSANDVEFVDEPTSTNDQPLHLTSTPTAGDEPVAPDLTKILDLPTKPDTQNLAAIGAGKYSSFIAPYAVPTHGLDPNDPDLQNKLIGRLEEAMAKKYGLTVDKVREVTGGMDMHFPDIGPKAVSAVQAKDSKFNGFLPMHIPSDFGLALQGEAKLEQWAKLSPDERETIAATIAKTRELTDREKAVLAPETITGNTLPEMVTRGLKPLGTAAMTGLAKGGGALYAGIGKTAQDIIPEAVKKAVPGAKAVAAGGAALETFGKEGQEASDQYRRVHGTNGTAEEVIHWAAEQAPETAISVALPGGRIVQMPFWAATMYTKARGQGASVSDALGSAVTGTVIGEGFHVAGKSAGLVKQGITGVAGEVADKGLSGLSRDLHRIPPVEGTEGHLLDTSAGSRFGSSPETRGVLSAQNIADHALLRDALETGADVPPEVLERNKAFIAQIHAEQDARVAAAPPGARLAPRRLPTPAERRNLIAGAERGQRFIDESGGPRSANQFVVKDSQGVEIWRGPATDAADAVKQAGPKARSAVALVEHGERQIATGGVEDFQEQADKTAPTLPTFEERAAQAREAVAAGGGERVEKSPLDIQKENMRDYRSDPGSEESAAPIEGFPVSVKNATNEAERAAQGLPPIETTTRPTADIHETAAANYDPRAARNLVDEVAATPRSLTPDETATLTLHKAHLNNEYNAAADELFAAHDANYPAAISRAQAKLDAINIDRDAFYDAAKSSGYEQSLSFNMRKAMMNEDYSLAALERQARVANGGEKLSTETLGELNEARKRIETAEAALAAHAEKSAQLEAENAFLKLQQETGQKGRAGRKIARTTKAADLDSEFKSLVAQLRGGSGERGGTQAGAVTIDAEAIAIIAKLAKNRVAAGINTVADLVDAVYTAIKTHIPGITERDVRDVISGYGKTAQGRTPSPLQAEITRLRSEMRNLSKTEDIASGVRDSPALQGRKTYLRNRLKELEGQLASGNFTKAKRTPLTLDNEALKLKADVERAKAEARVRIKQIEQGQRGFWEKVMNTGIQVRRQVLLSSLATLDKLAMFSLMRGVSAPVEQGIAGVAGKLPGLRKIAELAPRHGAFHFAAEWRGARRYVHEWFDAFKPGVDSAMGHAIRSGKVSIDELYGKKLDLPPEMIEVFGRVHSALKAPAKLAEFERSLTYRLMWEAKRQGKTFAEMEKDPAVMATHGAAAYADANRAILLQDNVINKMLTAAVTTAEHSKQFPTAGKVAAGAIKFALPITKVPTNYLIEAHQYIPVIGSTQAVHGIGKAMLKGAKSLSPEQADAVFRVIGKQGAGAAAFLVGVAASKSIGGYYEGKKREEERGAHDPRPKDIIIGGYHVPHGLTHHPALEIMQMGATFGRIAHQRGSTGEAAFWSAAGLLSQSPFYEQSVQSTRAFETPEGFGKFVGENIKSVLLPPDVQRLAGILDQRPKPSVAKGVAQQVGLAQAKPIPRRPKGVIQTVKMGIPGLRATVPPK